MGVRALRARIECDRETLQHLWRTHCVFNERLPEILGILFAMRRGEIGDTEEQRAKMQAFIWGILQQPAQNTYDPLIKAANGSDRNTTARNALNKQVTQAKEIIEGEATAHDDEERRQASALLNRCEQYAAAFDQFVTGWTPLQAFKDSLADLPNTIERKLFEESAACIRGHLALVERWNEQHEAWLAAKSQWESDPEHQKYLALRPRFDAFEKEVGGKITKRRGRWHLYLQWFRENPDLAAWRGKEPVVRDFTERARARIESAKPWKKNSVEAEEFWKANRELAALDRLHGYYEREFVRRRKRKRNSDGFDHPPTFTMPSPIKHPRWLVFSGPQTSPTGYKNLILPPRRRGIGSIDLLLLKGDCEDDGYPHDWVSVRYRADPRMASLRRVKVEKAYTKGAKKGQLKTVESFEMFDQQLERWRPAKIGGAKLIFQDIRLNEDGSLKSATPYLVFTCTLDDLPRSERAKKIKWDENKKRYRPPKGLVACAIDLRLLDIAFATHAAYEGGMPRVVRSRNLWVSVPQIDDGDDRPTGWRHGPELGHIARHKRSLKRRRQQRGKPVHGERSHIGLQEHITNMGEDRFKKSARKIVNHALSVDGETSAKGDRYPPADVLLIERLGRDARGRAGLIPDAAKERGINRAIAGWNRGHLVERIKEMANDAGLRVIEVAPHGTSQVCCRCGALGRRYSIKRNEESGRAEIVFGFVEKLFACPKCGYRVNADHNASVNLHRRFALGKDAVSAYFEHRNRPENQQREELAAIESSLRPPLDQMHGLIESPF